MLKHVVAEILRDPLNREWTVQGFGMIRTYLGPPDNRKRIRLNVWHSQLVFPGVSTIHNHPWDFTSVIIAGCFCNVRYAHDNENPNVTHEYAIIKTGIGGGMKTVRGSTALRAMKPELYKSGDTYSQKADEVHESFYVDGTVTLNERVGDTEQAEVYWPVGEQWVDAMPRVATSVEVLGATSLALKEWF